MDRAAFAFDRVRFKISEPRKKHFKSAGNPPKLTTGKGLVRTKSFARNRAFFLVARRKELRALEKQRVEDNKRTKSRRKTTYPVGSGLLKGKNQNFFNLGGGGGKGEASRGMNHPVKNLFLLKPWEGGGSEEIHDKKGVPRKLGKLAIIR